jgi:hypothetical protein
VLTGPHWILLFSTESGTVAGDQAVVHLRYQRTAPVTDSRIKRMPDLF